MIVRLSVFLCLAVGLGSKAEVSVENSAYHNLLISFSPNVPAEDGKSLVDSVKVLLQNSSEVLQTAIGIRIASVSFHLPATWDTSSWENVTVEDATTSQRDAPSDVLVDATEQSAFGKDPFTLQYGGCGVPGQQITVPVDFLDREEDYPKGKLLAREWLKYRYGVFDENGFEKDEMYPSHYQITGTSNVIITECTDPEVEYNFKDPSGNNCSSPSESPSCEIHPEEESAANVTSSLMYFHKELPNVKHVCGKDDHIHKDLTLSKHNVLCDGKSIWEVLKLSSDFKSSDESPADAEEIQFSYIQETKPRVVVALENSEKLADKFESILFGVRRFLYDLPEGSQFALYSFNTQPTPVFPLAVLPSKATRNVAIAADFVSNDEVCTTCAVSTAVDVLVNDNPKMQGSVILIVGSPSSPEIPAELVEKLKTSQLCVTIIAFKGEDSIVNSFQTLLESSACSSKLELSLAEEKKTAFEKLYQAMELAVPQISTDTKTTTVNVDTFSNEISLTISTDPTADKFTLWLARLVETDSIVCMAGESSVALNQEVKSQNIASYTFDATDIDVKCSLKYPKLEPVFSQVQMTTKPGEYFDDNLWIQDPTLESDTSQMPVIIYARINFGNYPIRDASVIAEVIGPNGTKGDAVVLFDNGRGDPDITRNDGIYSGYYLDFVDVGEYSVTVTAKDNGLATIGKNGTSPCCGSEVKSSFFPVTSFQRTFETSFNVKKTRPEDGYKPLRIIDLRVDTFDPPNTITLKWTAPGGEVDKGKASSYEFHLFCESEDCDKNGTLPTWIMFNSSKPIPNMVGHKELTVLLFDRNATKNLTVSFGLKSVNHNGHKSDISNLVLVKLGESAQPPTTMNPVDDEPSRSTTVGMIVGGAVIGAFVLLILTAVVYFYGIKRRVPKSSKDTDSVPDHENGNAGFGSFKASQTRESSMIRVESFPVLLYTHDQLKDFKNKKKDPEPPLYKPDVTPKPWMSMDALPSNIAKKDGDSKSLESTSTEPANDNKFKSNEMKQLDDISYRSDPHLEKTAKF